MISERAQAARILQQVTANGRSLDAALPADVTNLTKAICYETLRWFYQLDAIAKQLLDKPLRTKNADIYCLILSGLCQLKYLNTAKHAVIDEAVKACQTFKKPWAKGLVNAVLRNFLRANDFKLDLQAKTAHPDWLIKQIKSAWPDDWEIILNENNQHPPMCLRVNQQKTSRDDYLKSLANAKPGSAKNSIICDAMHVTDLPGFEQGKVSVQDTAAQFAAELLDLQSSMHVLDACAAPGGKTAHILELEPSCKVTAIDQSKPRLEKVADNLKRIRASATLIIADANNSELWWDKNLFDRILIDAPCSGTGVIRRHPDIKLLRKPDDIKQFAEQQQALLNNLWPLLKPGGLLVYATCSIMPAENEEQIASFLNHHLDAKIKPIKLHVGKPQIHGWQLLPSADTDGFYYVCLYKDRLV